jgi:putative transposase
MNMQIRSFKFRIYPSKVQEKQMYQHLWMAKNLWNELLAHCKQTHNDFDYFPTKNTLQLIVKNTGLFSQTQQEVSHRVLNSIMRVFKLRKQGKKCGFPRFKSIDRMKSLHYPQYEFGFSLDKKLKVTPFGEISIKKHRKIEGRIKTLTLKRESSGKWFATFSVEQDKPIPKQNIGNKIGIDLGLIDFAVFSDETIIKNPRHFKKYEEKLAQYQRLLSRKEKRSRNRYKAKLRVARLHEKVANTRADFLHKTTTYLVNDYSLIALEKLASQEMAEQNFGKQINDAGWNMFSNTIAYKAEEAGCNVVFVDPKDTTQECSNCHEIVRKDLTERTHNCPFCGLSISRDLNAARNILIKATVGTTESNASGDGTAVSSMKEDATQLAASQQVSHAKACDRFIGW